jgi:hypothetical protein
MVVFLDFFIQFIFSVLFLYSAVQIIPKRILGLGVFFLDEFKLTCGDQFIGHTKHFSHRFLTFFENVIIEGLKSGFLCDFYSALEI